MWEPGLREPPCGFEKPLPPLANVEHEEGAGTIDLIPASEQCMVTRFPGNPAGLVSICYHLIRDLVRFADILEIGLLLPFKYYA